MIFKRYKLFLENKQSNEEIDSICKKYRIENYTINEDGTVDINGDVDLSFLGLSKLPLKFGKVSGNFSCGYNKLISLEGSPKWIGEDFECSFNELKTLEGGPETIIGNYSFSYNCLINFKGFPEDYDGRVNFSRNPISKLLKNIPEDKVSKFIYWCNELNVIDDKANVNEEWLEEVYYKLGLEYDADANHKIEITKLYSSWKF